MLHCSLHSVQCTWYSVTTRCVLFQGRDQTSDQRFDLSLLLDFLVDAQNVVPGVVWTSITLFSVLASSRDAPYMSKVFFLRLLEPS